MKRQMRRALLNESTSLYHIQYNVGDLVLVSTAGTKLEDQKLLPKWRGPALITQIVGANTYKIKTLFEKEELAHAAKLWFYLGSKWVPPVDLSQVAMHNMGDIIIDKILDIVYEDKTYQLTISWLGFSELHNTNEDLIKMYLLSKEMVVEFLNSEVTPMKARAQKYLDNYEKRTTGNIKGKSRRVICSMAEVVEVAEAVKVKGWFDIEKEILRVAIIKYGVGNFEKIRVHLPGKSRQQIYTMIQRIVAKQSLAEYHGIHLDILLVRKANIEKYGVVYYIESDRVVTREESEKLITSNRERFEISAEDRIAMRIPYFRRTNEVDMLCELIEHVESVKYDVVLLNDVHPPISNVEIYLEALRRKLTKLRLMVAEQETKRAAYSTAAKYFYRMLRQNPEWCVKEDLVVELKDGVVVYGDGRNKYKFTGLSEVSLKRHIQPVGNICWKENILMIDWKKVVEARVKLLGSGFGVCIVDAPWKFVGNDPVRGASLSYNQLSDEEILSIRLSEIVEDGFLFMWIIPSKEDLARSWIEREGFELVDRLAWIKLSRNGNMLLTSLGLHFGKCKDEIW